MTQESRFWDKIAERYAKQPVADEAAYRTKLEVTRGYLGPDMEVLEFGCGTGSTAIAHAPFVKHILATDISSKMLEIAQHKADEAEIANITFRQAGIDDLSVADGAFDVAMGMSILHLVKSRDAVIAKVHRMLKPGGVFVSSTTCVGGVLKLLALVSPITQRFGLLPLIRSFTVKQLEDSLIKAGFAIDYKWQPAKGKAVFFVAKKAG